MVSRQLLRSCQATADALPLREPYGSAQLVEDLAGARGRPIHIMPLPWLDGPSLPCGVWIATGDTDYVFIGQGATGVHREQIVLHEVGHIVCGHGTADSTELLERLMPNINPATIHQVLSRSSYTQPQEREAELVATLALARMSRIATAARPTDQSGLGAALGRLDLALGADG